MAYVSKIKDTNNNILDIKSKITAAIPYGECDETSTATVFTATVDGITELYDGVCVLLSNPVVNSSGNYTININGLGAKAVWNSKTGSRSSTLFSKNMTMLLVYSSTLNTEGAWIGYAGYYADNTDTIGYYLRHSYAVLPVSDTARYYKMYFTSADRTQWVPASINSTNNTTTARAVNQRPIDPFGEIVYTSASTNFKQGTNLTVSSAWLQYRFSLGYSFNVNGGTLALTTKTPIYLKCAPQADGSAIMDDTTPCVQTLPSTADGKIYIYLGIADSATTIELAYKHPVYYHDGTQIRLWTGVAVASQVYVDNAINNLPSPMVFKGTLGTDGTITSLPTASSINTGYTYKVITAGTYDSKAADVGDIFISDGSTWDLVPSGDDISSVIVTKVQTSGTKIATITVDSTSTDLYAPTPPSAATDNPVMDGTAAVGTSSKYAKEDHVHPTDTSRQATLVSGTNIKTINGTSLLGSGDIEIQSYWHYNSSNDTIELVFPQ